MDFDAIIGEIASGLRREDHLDWREYQGLVSFLIRRQNLKLAAESEITLSDFERHGEIDVVIRYMSPAITIGKDTHASSEAIFIECKQRRSGKLDLDEVGKVFCYSILQKPRALYVVSPFPLAPQARRCAESLFMVHGAPPGVFQHTEFHHRTLRDLLGLDDVEQGEHGAFHLADWSTTIEDVFHTAVVADRRFSASTVNVPAGATVKFEIVLTSDTSTEVDLRLISDEGLRICDASGKVNRSLSIEFRFRVAGEPVTLGRLEIEDKHTHDVTQIAMPRIQFILVSSSAVFGDLREKEAIKFAEGLTEYGAQRIGAIGGDAGVGKTYFCESVARHLKLQHGYHTMRAKVTPTEDFYTFLTLLKNIFLPIADARKSASPALQPGGDTELSVLCTVLAFVSEQRETPETMLQLLTRIQQRRHKNADPAALLDAFASAVRISPRPQLIVLNDCHKMSAPMATFLEMLIARLESSGWGNMRILLEFRARELEWSSAWRALEQKLTGEMGARFPHHWVEPLTLLQTIERVCSHIESPSPSETASVLMRQTGGNPLFLEHVIRHLLQSKVIVRDPSGGKAYRIDHFELFRRRIEELPPGLDAFLRLRVKDVIAAAPVQLRDALSAYLGLIAVITSSSTVSSPAIDENLLARILKCSLSTLHKLRHRIVAERFLRGGLGASTLDFVHDLMSAAALKAVEGHMAFRESALAYCGAVPPDTVADAIVGGRLSHLVGELDEAVMRFERGAEMADRTANFLEQRRCLEGVRATLDKVGATDPIAVTKRMGVWTRLIWTELQQGSQYAAEQFIQEARRELEAFASPGTVRSGVHAATRLELARFQVVLDVRRADVKKFVDDCRGYLAIAASPSDLHHVASRILLMALHTNAPNVAWRAAKSALRTINKSEHVLEMSSLYSGLGQFFVLENPKLAEGLWNRGLTVLETSAMGPDRERQRIHSMVNAAIIGTMLRPSESKLRELRDLAAVLTERGLTNPYVRLQTCIGALHFHLGDIDGAQFEWERGLATARSSSMRLYEWPYYHNLAVAALLRDRRTESTDLFRCALGSVQEILPYVGTPSGISKLADAVRDKVDFDLHAAEYVEGTIIGVNDREFSSVSVTSSLARLIHACRIVGAALPDSYLAADIPAAVPQLRPRPELAPLLAVRFGDQSLMLSVE